MADSYSASCSDCTNSGSSSAGTGVRTKSEAFDERAEARRRYDSRGSSAGESARSQIDQITLAGSYKPRVAALAMRTTVSLMPLSPSRRRLSPISRTSPSSISFSLASRAATSSAVSGAADAARSGDSYSRRNSTNTEGTSSACFRIQTGAIRPSGKQGELGVKGDKGE